MHLSLCVGHARTEPLDFLYVYMRSMVIHLAGYSIYPRPTLPVFPFSSFIDDVNLLKKTLEYLGIESEQMYAVSQSIRISDNAV